MTDTFTLRRKDIESLQAYNLHFSESWQVVDYFEKLVADFFGSPYAVAVDCSTHALELCLILENQKNSLSIPAHTYMSVPMMLDKLHINYQLTDEHWSETYNLTDKIIDAATMWRRNSYQTGTLTTISFQYKKHIPIGRGGMILLDDEHKYNKLQKMVRDGRDPKKTQFEDDVEELGYHYYMIPEDAARGIYLFLNLYSNHVQPWSWKDYRNLREMKYFKGK